MRIGMRRQTCRIGKRLNVQSRGGGRRDIAGGLPSFSRARGPGSLMSAPDKAVTQPVVIQPVVSTGIEGLDVVLSGGLTANRLYLIEGMPGSGKTTLAFHFLLEGVRRGEPVLYVALSETKEEAKVAAASHGWV